MRRDTRRAGRALSLIELLVVISIMALLITVLLPAMHEAKRHAQVVPCGSNLHQLGIGIASSVGDHDALPGPAEQTLIYSIGHVHFPGGLDLRRALVDIAGNRGADLWFCPLWTWARPADNLVQSEYSTQFLIDDAGRHVAGYTVLFLLMKDSAFDWTYSRLPEGPYDRDDNQVVLITDENYNHPSICADWQNPPGGRHSADPLAGPMRESNRLHTDGHVETVRALFEQAVVRWGEFHRAF